MPRTKEEISIYNREYHIKNKEKILQRQKERYQLNTEKIKQQQKEYQKTDAGKKSRKISNWKFRGIILREGEDWDSIYRTYIECKNCEQCNKVFKNSKDRQLDHCHTTGFIRNIVCNSCNQLRRYEDAKLIWVIQQD